MTENSDADRRWQLVLRGLLVVMAVLATLKLGNELWRLMLQEVGPGATGATDLRKFHYLTNRWFDGILRYKRTGGAVYFPATFVYMWPVVGWLDFEVSRWLWGLTNMAALALLAVALVRETGAATRLERACVAFTVFSMNAVGVTVGIGQLGVVVVLLLLLATLRLRRQPPSLAGDLALATLMAVALVKPTVSAPFFWIIICVPGRLRPALLTVGLYVAVTAFAMLFYQSGTTGAAVAGSVQQSLAGARVGVMQGGYGNLHSWLTTLSGITGDVRWDNDRTHLLNRLYAVSSGLALLLAGGWAWRFRRVNLWTQLAFLAVVARIWCYHRVYDDVLLLIPAAALARLSFRTDLDRRLLNLARVLFTTLVLVQLTPARFRHGLGSAFYEAGHVVTWFAVLVFFGWLASRERSATKAPA